MTTTSNDSIAPRKWLTRQEVADRLRIPAKTLEFWACKGKSAGGKQEGPRFAKFGAHVRYLESDVVAWEDACLTEPTKTV